MATLVLLAFGCVSLAACGEPAGATPATPSWVIAVTATSAEPQPALPRDARGEIEQQAAKSKKVGEALVTVLVQGGEPVSVDLTPMRGKRVEHAPRKRARALAENLEALDRLVAKAASGVDGLDALSLLDKAARVDPDATLVLLSSGVATHGPLSILGNGWREDPAPLVAHLQRKGYLPAHLAGRHVRMYYLGEVAGSQPELIQSLRAGLERLYLLTCRTAGAASCRIFPDLPSARPPTVTRPVPVVPVVEIVYQPLGPCRTTAFVPSAILFAGGSAELGPDADDVLRPIADQVIDAADSGDPAQTWVIARIIGHTRDIDAGSGLALSRMRAQAVSRRLAALGVEPRQIGTVEGVGEAEPVVPDFLPDGSPNPLAERNRRVEIVLELVQCPQA